MLEQVQCMLPARLFEPLKLVDLALAEKEQ